MITGIDRIAQVKLPVTDLGRSVDWYRSLLDLRLWTEFVEDGEVRGAGLIDEGGRFNVALRDRRYCAGQPDLSGFDVVAFMITDPAALDELMARCERLGIAYDGLRDTPAGPQLDIPDPDRTVLRFYHFTGSLDGFTGIESRGGRYVAGYRTPRLAVTGRR
jgi:catechol 2,3-dioxygenase-like lactoylglutathione lyase family enzyme